MRNAKKSLKSPIPQWWRKWKSDPKSVSATGSPPKVNDVYRLEGPSLTPSFNEIIWLLLQQEIRSVELGVCPMQLFHFWSIDVHPVQNLLLCTKFHRNRMIFRWDMAIHRFSKWRPSAILELFYHHTRPPTKSLLLAAAACQISCQSDTQIWTYNYLNFSHIWLEMTIQAIKMGGFGDFWSLNVIIHHRDLQMAHPCVNPRLLSYQL